jgi:hypothetical protein
MAASRFSHSERPVILRKRKNRCHRSEWLSKIKVHTTRFGASRQAAEFLEGDLAVLPDLPHPHAPPIRFSFNLSRQNYDSFC